MLLCQEMCKLDLLAGKRKPVLDPKKAMLSLWVKLDERGIYPIALTMEGIFHEKKLISQHVQ
jgi:hypothetical protein